MRDPIRLSSESEVELLGFALSNCTVEIDPESTKYLRAVHRTALDLAVQNQFGTEVGGFWLLADQISQLRKLSEYYSPDEARVVAEVIETYLSAQLDSLYQIYR